MPKNELELNSKPSGSPDKIKICENCISKKYMPFPHYLIKKMKCLNPLCDNFWPTTRVKTIFEITRLE